MNQIMRLFIILRTIAQYQLIKLAPAKKIGRPLKFILWLCGLGVIKKDSNGTDIASASNGLRLRLALQTLGPIHIKFGQLLSTRRDMLPEEIADELAKLQDRVEPFASDIAIEIIETQLQQPINKAFQTFEHSPLASASVAQVHAATLHNGDEVVVKVVRPNIEKIIERDIKLLFFIARILEYFSDDARRLHLIELIYDYEKVIFSELDLKQEAANGSQLKRNFEENDHLRSLLQVPKVYWDFNTEKILVLERVYGVPISEVETLKNKNTNLQRLAENGVEIFFTQVFEHNFFHADMHPGNIFVDTNDPDNPQYIALDCAIMGTLSEVDRYYVARILLAALERDYRLVTRLYLESGWLDAKTPAASFESLIRSVCEPIFSKPISELSFGTLLVYLFQAARRFGMEVQPSLVLLQKTLVNVEGLGQQLYPDLDLWQTAQPFLNQWVNKNYSAEGFLKNLQNKVPAFFESLPVLPNKLISTIQQISPAAGQNNQLYDRVTKLETRLQRHRKLNITLLLIAVVWLATFLIN